MNQFTFGLGVGLLVVSACTALKKDPQWVPVEGNVEKFETDAKVCYRWAALTCAAKPLAPGIVP